MTHKEATELIESIKNSGYLHSIDNNKLINLNEYDIIYFESRLDYSDRWHDSIKSINIDWITPDKDSSHTTRIKRFGAKVYERGVAFIAVSKDKYEAYKAIKESKELLENQINIMIKQ